MREEFLRKPVKTALAEETAFSALPEEQVDRLPDYPEYFAAASVDEAVDILGRFGGSAGILAGGLDIVSLIKRETLAAPPKALVSIRRIPDMNDISMSNGSLKIKALAGINDLERSEPVRRRYPMLAEAAHAVGSPQVRNMGTVVGNLCQDVRCLYYRRPKGTGTDFHCRRKTPEGVCHAFCGENRDHSIFNDSGCECFAPCLSDLAVALTAFDARIRTVDSAGGRSLSVPELFTPLGKTLRPDEVVTSVEIPNCEGNVVTAFHKLRVRRAIDFAIVSAAAVVRLEGDTVRDARVAVGGVHYAPYRDAEAEQYLIGKPLTYDNASKAAEILVSKARPLDKNAYKARITNALVRRAVLGEKDR
jgi:xanthine dehydrogenase YagS FAD-binding subunit